MNLTVITHSNLRKVLNHGYSKSMQLYFCNEFSVFIIAKDTQPGFDIYFYHNYKRIRKIVIDWPGADKINARVSENDIVFYDYHGRVCSVDVIKNQIDHFIL